MMGIKLRTALGLTVIAAAGGGVASLEMVALDHGNFAQKIDKAFKVQPTPKVTPPTQKKGPGAGNRAQYCAAVGSVAGINTYTPNQAVRLTSAVQQAVDFSSAADRPYWNSLQTVLVASVPAGGVATTQGALQTASNSGSPSQAAAVANVNRLRSRVASRTQQQCNIDIYSIS